MKNSLETRLGFFAALIVIADAAIGLLEQLGRQLGHEPA